MIVLSDAAVVLNGPEDPELARVWDLAIAKFTTRQGHPPDTREDARAVVEDYQRLLAKPHGSLATVVAQVLQERCSEVPSGD